MEHTNLKPIHALNSLVPNDRMPLNMKEIIQIDQGTALEASRSAYGFPYGGKFPSLRIQPSPNASRR